MNTFKVVPKMYLKSNKILTLGLICMDSLLEIIMYVFLNRIA